MASRIAALDDKVQLVDRRAGRIRAVVRGPEPSARVEDEIVRIAQARREDAHVAAVWIGLQDRTGALVYLIAVVTGCAVRKVERQSPLRGARGGLQSCA